MILQLLIYNYFVIIKIIKLAFVKRIRVKNKKKMWRNIRLICKKSDRWMYLFETICIWIHTAGNVSTLLRPRFGLLPRTTKLLRLLWSRVDQHQRCSHTWRTYILCSSKHSFWKLAGNMQLILFYITFILYMQIFSIF